MPRFGSCPPGGPALCGETPEEAAWGGRKCPWGRGGGGGGKPVWERRALGIPGGEACRQAACSGRRGGRSGLSASARGAGEGPAGLLPSHLEGRVLAQAPSGGLGAPASPAASSFPEGGRGAVASWGRPAQLGPGQRLHPTSLGTGAAVTHISAPAARPLLSP